MASSPPPSAPGRITEILARIRAGEASADDLIPFVYDELRLLARRRMPRHGTSGTLQPTVLVHEAYLRLVGLESPTWENRAHFFAVAALAMRQLLANHARDRAAGKRGGGHQRVTLDDEVTPGSTPNLDLLALSQALDRLEALDERQARIVTLRFLSGMSVPEVAHALSISTATVEREWRVAKAWLSSALAPRA
jgi:RNA polymerase sigma factor (TIGR02999 family)